MSARACLDCVAQIFPPKTRCAECNRVHQNALKATWRKNNAKQDAAIRQRYRASAKGRAVQRDRHLRKTFGISLADFEARLKDQGGRCDICGADKPEGNGTWHVDHDHATGAVRGLLCLNCNALLGHARDSELILEFAAAYLRRHALGVRVIRCA